MRNKSESPGRVNPPSGDASPEAFPARAPSHRVLTYPTPLHPEQTGPAQGNPAQTNPAQTNPAQTNPAQSNSDTSAPGAAAAPATLPKALAALAQDMTDRCKLCKMCEKECPLIKEQGMPGELAARLLAGDLSVEQAVEIAFRCSLCGLCTQLCTVRGLDPGGFFRTLREQAVRRDPARLKPYKRLLAYERTGLTRAFSFYGLPPGVRRVFFPGCALSGSRPETTLRTLHRLREQDSRTGFVMHCCARPSLTLGRREFFLEQCRTLFKRLEQSGVQEILTACPQCSSALQEAGPSLAVRTVYEVLAGHDPEPGPGMERVKTAVHDPCALRGERSMHAGVRTLLWNHGCSVSEMRHAHHKALCCGEGGGLALAHPEQAEIWLQMRLQEAKGRELAVYCAGCLERLAPHAPVRHVLDIVLDGPEAEPARPVSGPQAYRNRRHLKEEAAKLYGTKG